MRFMISGRSPLCCWAVIQPIIAEAKCGISLPQGTPEGIKDALLEFHSLPEDRLKDIGNKGKKYVLEHHEYQKLADKFLQIMKSLR